VKPAEDDDVDIEAELRNAEFTPAQTAVLLRLVGNTTKLEQKTTDAHAVWPTMVKAVAARWTENPTNWQ
jgi:hypothetical protein